MQAVCALIAIAMVHSDSRLASIIAMGIFTTGVAASMLLSEVAREFIARR
jgi:multisubunit Na+/H+ antiporter MnhB subunit